MEINSDKLLEVIVFKDSNVSLVILWDILSPLSPNKIFLVQQQITVICTSRAVDWLILAGSLDGSIILWDSRERKLLHQNN